MLGFFEEAVAFKVDDLPDLSGKVALVTGGNTGLGYETCEALAGKGALVFMAARSGEKAKESIDKIKAKHPNSHVEWLQLDLQDFDSIKQAAQDFQKRAGRLDSFVANAGIMAVEYQILDKSGLEIQFATNVMGHALLCFLLLPILISTSRRPEYETNGTVRIVNLSSIAHQRGMGVQRDSSFKSTDLINRQFNRWHTMAPYARYGQSKLANILFNNALQKRLSNEKITCIAVHPGAVATNLLGRSYVTTRWLTAILTTLFLIPSTQGALTQIFAAASPKVDEGDYKGVYLVPIAKKAMPSVQAQSEQLAEELWTFLSDYAREKANVDVKTLLKEARKPHAAAKET